MYQIILQYYYCYDIGYFGWYERSSAAEVWLQTSERRTHMPGRQCLGPSID